MTNVRENAMPQTSIPARAERASRRPSVVAKAYFHAAEAIGKSVVDVPQLPRAAHFIPTWKCDLKCATCQVWKRGAWEDELDTSAMIGIIKKLACLDIVKVIGGEPFARPDLSELCDAMWEHIDPYLLQITTAGTRTDRIVPFLERHGRPGLQIRVSMDGLEDIYPKMRRGDEEHGYRQVVETIREGSKLARERGFSMGVNFCVTDKSVEDLPKVVAFCREHGVDCVPGMAVQPFLQHVPDWESVEHKVLMIDEPDKVADVMRRVDWGSKQGIGKAAAAFLKRENVHLFAERMHHRPVKPFGCREVRSLAYLMPNGDMAVCGLRYDAIGNLTQNTVEEIWTSPRATELRGLVDACQGCQQASTQIMSRMYGGSVAPRREEPRW
ncbi:radical SAM protein [bacterium]|nr:radical SAM protein [bacterium]